MSIDIDVAMVHGVVVKSNDATTGDLGSREHLEFEN